MDSGYGIFAIKTLTALAFISVLAFFVLRWLHRFRVARLGEGQLQVRDRIYLSNKHQLVLVSCANRTWLIGAGDGASPCLLAELDTFPSADDGDVGRSEKESTATNAVVERSSV